MGEWIYWYIIKNKVFYSTFNCIITKLTTDKQPANNFVLINSLEWINEVLLNGLITVNWQLVKRLYMDPFYFFKSSCDLDTVWNPVWWLTVWSLTAAATPSHRHTVLPAVRQEEGSGAAGGWVGRLWVTRCHWPVWQPDKLTLCLTRPCGRILRQHASPIGSWRMMLGDSRRAFYHGKGWTQSLHGHRWSEEAPACWICKCGVNLGQQSKS